MADNLNEVLKALVSEMDKKTIDEAIPKLKKVLSTNEGRELMRKIKSADCTSLERLIGEIKPRGKSGFGGLSDNPEEVRRLIEGFFGRE